MHSFIRGLILYTCAGVVIALAIIGFVFTLCAALGKNAGAAEPVSAGTFYQFTDPASGAVAFTDDPKMIPPAARDTRPRRLEELRTTTSARVTVSDPAELPYVPAYQPSANPHRLKDCSGPVTVRQERRQVGDYSRTFYVAYNECGQEIFNSPFPIHLEVKR